jgi:mono/diheme cytochrome c family protein
MSIFWSDRSKLCWAAAALFAGSAAAVYAPVSAGPPVRADTSLFSEVQAARGSEVAANHCAVCHGAELTGGGGAPSLKGPDFLFGWSGKTTKELVEYIASTMPPGQGRSLTEQEYEDAAAYILGTNGFPAGQSSLSAATATLIGQPPDAAPQK